MSYRTIFIIAVIITFILCGFWGVLGPNLIYWIHSERFQDSYTISDAGSWGESFAGLNTLFSGLAFSAVALTIYMQYHSNLERNSEKIDEDNKYKRDQFDKNFFQLLKLLEKSRENIKRKKEKVEYFTLEPIPLNGFDAIDEYYISIGNVLRSHSVHHKFKIHELNKITENELYNHNESQLGIYFRTIYTILNRIEKEQSISQEEKYNYGNLLRSQLSSNEVTLIALNGLHRKSKDLKDYIIYFRLLRYSSSGIIKRALRAHYPPETFAPRDD